MLVQRVYCIPWKGIGRPVDILQVPMVSVPRRSSSCHVWRKFFSKAFLGKVIISYGVDDWLVMVAAQHVLNRMNRFNSHLRQADTSPRPFMARFFWCSG